MIVNMRGVSVIGCGTGVSVPQGTELSIEGGAFVRNGNAVVVRDPPSFMESLGLPRDTDPQLVIEALVELKRVKESPVPTQIEALRETRLVKALGVAANLAGIYGALISPPAQALMAVIAAQL